jgi:hypothetical protein
MLSTAVCALLGLIYLGSSAAFNAFTGGKSPLLMILRWLIISGYHLSWMLLCLSRFVFLDQRQERRPKRSLLPWQIRLPHCKSPSSPVVPAADT